MMVCLVIGRWTLDDGPRSIVNGLWSLLRISHSGGNDNFGELSLKVRKKRVCHVFGRAVAFGPVPAFVLTRVLRCGGESLCHRVRVNFVLNFVRELFLDRAPIALDGDGLGNVFPVHDAIFCHEDPLHLSFDCAALMVAPRRAN
jgi:hypothetical protein